ncbi:MAG: alginate lyase family protein, partial [Planctomycetes bacterium]|nr:alginate lyase family protein [Planctomycetota bacterium]
TGGRGERDLPWYEIPDFRPTSGDMRTLWDPARAAWAIDLARARAHRLKAAARDLYWRWVDSWMQSCPPFRGSQWKCGQEAAVRLIALTIGFWALQEESAAAGISPSPVTPGEGRVRAWLALARIAYITGTRIVHHISYAVSQKNNHALSEAVGLMLASHLFPEFRDAPQWRTIGRRVLTQAMRRQIYPDGSYVQHSMNYHRVMLNVCTLGLRLAELAEQPLEHDLYERLGAAAEFAFQMMEPRSGQLPNYGNNDGALVLPLSECDFTDFRPAIQSAYFAANRKRLLPPGPWDEETVWLFGASPPSMPCGDELTSSAFSHGGYYTLRAEESWAMVRCHAYRDRQTQLDTLHVDLWWRGQNVLCDSGTYQYYTPGNPALERYFKCVSGHNVVELDGRDPAELASRFLWLPWSRARELRFAAGEQSLCFEGESADYDRGGRGVLWRRTVDCLPLGTWLIVDDLLGSGDHGVILRWHMLDAPYTLDEANGACRLQTAGGEFVVAVATGDPSPTRALAVVRNVVSVEKVQGVASRYYGHLTPAPTLELSVWENLPLRIVTTAGPATAAARRLEKTPDGETWQVTDRGEEARIRLGPCERGAAQTFLGGI